MSDQIFNQISDGMATLHDNLRQAFLPTGARLFLLKKAENSGTRLKVVKELTAGWYIEFSEYRGLFKLLYATRDAAFIDEIAQTTFIAYGVPDASDKLEVFAIDPERRDIIPPTGSNPLWKVYVDKQPNLRFTVPPAEENDDMKLSTTTISVESPGKQNLFTVPTGKKCLVTLNNVRGGNSNMADAGSLSFGFDSEASDFGTMATGQTRSLLNEDSAASLPPNTSVFAVGTAGQVFGCKFSGGETSGSNSLQVDVIGYLVDA